jgi:starvation-inducible DNA-binding protein
MGIVFNDGDEKPVNLSGYAINKAAGNSQPLADSLKVLLADNVSIYSRAHGYHWNVEGQDFTEYHILFGAIYDDLQDAIDPLGESIRKLGDYPPYRLQDFVAMRSVQDSPVPPAEPIAMALDLLTGIDALLAGFNKAAAIATQLNEQGVLNFLVGRVEMLQKWKWQLTASLR